MRSTLWAVLGASAFVAWHPCAAADIQVFDSAAAFFDAVGPTNRFPTSLRAPRSNFAGVGGYFGGQFFEFGEYHPAFNALDLLDFTPLLAGNELRISSRVQPGYPPGKQNADVLLYPPGDPTGTVYSFGVELADGGFSPGDATFTVRLVRHQMPGTVGTLEFRLPDATAGFVGVWSADPFNYVEIRETGDNPADAFFGDLYAGYVPFVRPQTADVPTPEPSSLALLAVAGLLGAARACYQRRPRTSPTR